MRGYTGRMMLAHFGTVANLHFLLEKIGRIEKNTSSSVQKDKTRLEVSLNNFMLAIQLISVPLAHYRKKSQEKRIQASCELRFTFMSVVVCWAFTLFLLVKQ